MRKVRNPAPLSEASALLVREDENPAVVYLARLAEGSSRPSMMSALKVLADLASDGRAVDPFTFDWMQPGLDPVGLRAKVAERFAPATANRMLSCLRGVMRECWRNGRMGAGAYLKIKDLPSVREEAPGRQMLTPRQM